MIELDEEQQRARTWFESLRDRICAEFEAIEREAGSEAAFAYTSWDRADADPGSERGAGSSSGGGDRQAGLWSGEVRVVVPAEAPVLA
jgi:coproporphyrinogen III oxidase